MFGFLRFVTGLKNRKLAKTADVGCASTSSNQLGGWNDGSVYPFTDGLRLQEGQFSCDCIVSADVLVGMTGMTGQTSQSDLGDEGEVQDAGHCHCYHMSFQ
jgi:hypothetical protein